MTIVPGRGYGRGRYGRWRYGRLLPNFKPGNPATSWRANRKFFVTWK